MKTITGTGSIMPQDYKEITWIGKTKDERMAKIILHDALNKGNIDWTLAEKDEVVAEIVFEACYDDEAKDEYKEPWEITFADDNNSGDFTGDILLGLGKVYVDDQYVGKTRGGGKFTRELEVRDIVADGDRGSVKDRVVIDTSRASLTFSALQVVTRMTDLYPGLEEIDA